MLTKPNNNGIPAYRRIQGAIRSVIEAGELKPGDALSHPKGNSLGSTTSA